jgi:hypothetical protein
MSDNEDNYNSESESVSESEPESVASDESEKLSNDEDDGIINYNSEIDSDDEKKIVKKETVKKNNKKKGKKNDDDDDEDYVADEYNSADEGDEPEIEIKTIQLDTAKKINSKFAIIVDPRDLDELRKPNPTMIKEILVDENKYKSSEYIQIYEFCEIISIRSQHISDGADIYVDLESETTAREIAKKELRLGCCPFMIKRYMTPINHDPVFVEVWNPNNMGINSKFFSY